ncbi:MAG: alginate export family protein, partial [Candidatus Omnitrophota bacterium]|nr:alginate export family protein [Candidatus Omnitrophota bacterium]
HRENLDLHQEDVTSAEGVFDDEDDFFQQTVGINVGADLTENVSANIRLANEREWDTDGTATGDFDVSQAYVSLKELFYAPLTLRVGTQPIVWGRGFVLGSNLLPTVFPGDDRNAAIVANEFTDFTAFDAIRATLDLSGMSGGMPVTVDAVYVKLNERISGTPDDENLVGVNFGTRFDEMNSELETYYLNKSDKSPGGTAAVTAANQADASVSTWGIRGSAKPAEGTYVYGELAYQWGTRDLDINGGTLPTGDAQQAWAINLGADFTLTGAAMTPKIGGEWIYFSGKDADGAVQGWDPIARGYFTTALREFQTAGASGFYGTDQAGDTSAATNQHQLSIYGSFTPIEDLSVSPRLSWFILDVGAIPVAGSKRQSFAGTEWDTVVNYNYTDDVQLGLIYALFLPGNVYRTAVTGGTSGDSTAQELITSVSVKF